MTRRAASSSLAVPPLGKSRSSELKRRRRSLMRIMGEHSIAVLPSAPVSYRSRDTEYGYRPDSNFAYLTGFHEPEALMVLVPNRKAGQYLIFCRERDASRELWDGRRLGVEQAPEVLGADDAFPIEDADDILPGLLEGRQSVFHTLGKDQHFDARLIGWLNRARSSRRHGSDPDTFVSLDHHIHDMRVYKSRSELALMRKAASITVAGHAAAMKLCRPGLFEYELEAELIREYTRQGARHAFLPIVGGGANGGILHYVENRQRLIDGDLVLVDSGAEHELYAGDVTRTYPVNGQFSDAQRELYELVLEAQLEAINAVRPGNHWNDPHDRAVRVLARGLRELGVLKGKVPTLIKKEAYKQYYMHGTSHFLGMDVHDVGDQKIDGNWRLLEPGMVLTVEPGLYLGSERKIPRRYHDTGIRIEDDVLVTEGEPDVLTEALPKRADAIEALMAGQT